MNKLGITDEQAKELTALANIGFAFMEMLKAVPPEISSLYEPYFGHRGARNKTRIWVSRFCAVSLAIAKGYTAEEREIHLKEKQSNETNQVKGK